MKLVILLLPALFASSLAFAADEEPKYGDITCNGARGDEASLTIASKITIYKDEANMRDLTAVWLTFGDRKPATGRIKYLENDKKYKAIKYKNYYRFNLYELTDVEDFGRFYPDSCDIKVMIPFTAGETSEFRAPVQYSCEQSGGVLTMDCTYTERK